MSLDAGFDLSPGLSKSKEDVEAWKIFMDEVQHRYSGDEYVAVTPVSIVFKIAEHPELPRDGYKFLRFSSKISGKQGNEVAEYIRDVGYIARKHFGERVHLWNEMSESWSVFRWSKVNESIQSYKQSDKSKVSSTTTSMDTEGSNTGIVTEGESMYRIDTLPNRGRGLVASRDIAAGTRILSEKPLFTVSGSTLRGAQDLESHIGTRLKSLPQPDQRKFLALFNNFPGKYPLSGTFKTNALPCGEDSPVGAVYANACFLNHSCRPNASHCWNLNTQCETIHAIRLIKAGEEITINYALGLPRESRRLHLRQSFGFDCDCVTCSLSPQEIRVSDHRRTQIARLDGAIGEGYRMLNDPADSLAKCYSLLQLLQVEYGENTSLVARLYYDAFQICIFHGDQARATLFAERAYKLRILCQGEDSPETIEMRSLMNNPTSHPTFGISQRWKTAKSSAPKGLGSEEFEKWLWKQRKI